MSENGPQPRGGEEGHLATSVDRLPAKFELPSSLRWFANRLRVRLEHLGLTDPEFLRRLDNARKKMLAVLKKKKIDDLTAKLAIERALDAAANYQIQPLRREQGEKKRAARIARLQDLLELLERLCKAIAKLPPVSKAALNRLIADRNWAEFDAEMFAQVVDELLDVLSRVSPERHARDAALELREPLSRRDPVVAINVRMAPPVVVELWDGIPDQTRAEVEAKMRDWTPPARGQATAFLDRLKVLLHRHWPKLRPGRRQSMMSAYLQDIAAIWRQLNLKVGEARGGSREKRAESLFHQFANEAFRAVGDNSVITIRQIGNLKRAQERR